MIVILNWIERQSLTVALRHCWLNRQTSLQLDISLRMIILDGVKIGYNSHLDSAAVRRPVKGEVSWKN